MAFFDNLISAAVPSLINAGVSLIGSDQARGANQDAVRFITEGLDEAAGIYGTAYDDVLGYETAALDNERTLRDQEFPLLIDAMRGVRDDYSGDIRNAYGQYGDMMYSADDDYWNTMLLADAAFRGLVEGGAQTADQAMFGGRDAVTAMYAPYTDGGREAIGELRRIAASDPSVLTPSQLRAKDRLMRDMRAGMASSGLRGDGRAGVAAFNEGLAEYETAAFDENRDRIDRAISALTSAGLTGTAAGAGATERAAGYSADNWRRAWNDMADMNMRVQDKGASNRFATTQRVGDTMLRGEDAIASANRTYGDRMMDETRDFYDDSARLGYAEADALRRNILGKADADAAAAAGPAYAQANAATASGRIQGETTGVIGQFFADAWKDAMRTSPATG